MYTWMRKGLQSKEEYEISKCLFFAYLNSNTVLKVMGKNSSAAICDFVRCHVIPHEKHYVFIVEKE